MKKENLKNKKFYKLLVIDTAVSKITPKGKKVTQWLCLCDCGNNIIVSSNNLKNGHTRSCGCLNCGNNIKHNQSYSRLYTTWTNIKQRCNNVNSNSFKDYGARGIKVCNEWLHDFENFYNWAINNGYQENLTIERIDINGNYEPNNCKWITKFEQAHNKRNSNIVKIGNESHCITEWSRILNIPLSTLRRKSKFELDCIYKELNKEL